MKRIGIVGVGGVASYAHIPSYINRDIDVWSICDINEKKLNTIGNLYNISRRYTDIEEMIKKENIDVLDIATPPSSHKEILKIANKYKVQVVMQKPLITDEREMDDISALILSSDRFKLNMQGRYVSAWAKIKKLLKNESIGKPLMCTIVNNDWWDREEGRWDLNINNYIIFEMLIHHLDLCHFWFGKPFKVTARGGKNDSQNIKKMNYINVMLEYKNGLIVQIIENWGMSEYDFSTGHPFEDILITGEKGTIKANSEMVKLSKINNNEMNVWLHPRPGQKLPCDILKNNWFNDAFGELMKDFIYNNNIGYDDDKNYAIELTKMLFKIAEATTSDNWIEF